MDYAPHDWKEHTDMNASNTLCNKAFGVPHYPALYLLGTPVEDGSSQLFVTYLSSQSPTCRDACIVPTLPLDKPPETLFLNSGTMASYRTLLGIFPNTAIEEDSLADGRCALQVDHRRTIHVQTHPWCETRKRGKNQPTWPEI